MAILLCDDESMHDSEYAKISEYLHYKMPTRDTVSGGT